MRLVIKDVEYHQCEIHPLAHDAYLYSLKLKFQLSNKWRETYGLSKLSPAWAVYDKESRRYLVFSHWKNLLPRCQNHDQKLSVFVWSEADDIAEGAWRYVAKLLSDSVHRKDILYNVIQSLDVFPANLRGKAEQATGGKSSLESLTRFYSTECTRAPVRSAFEHYQKDKRDTYAD